MNRLAKEIFNAPRHSEKIIKFREISDNRGLDRSKFDTGINNKGYLASRMKLYLAIYNYCNR